MWILRILQIGRKEKEKNVIIYWQLHRVILIQKTDGIKKGERDVECVGLLSFINKLWEKRNLKVLRDLLCGYCWGKR